MILYFLAAGVYLFSFVNKDEKLDLIGSFILQLGILCHLISIGDYVASTYDAGLDFNHFPFLTLIYFIVAVVYLMYRHKYKVKYVGFFYLLIPLLFLFMGISSKSGLADFHSLSPDSIHFYSVFSFLALSLLTVSFVSSIFYLTQNSRLKNKSFDFWFHRLPDLKTLDGMTYGSTLLGFIFLTLSILSGVVHYHGKGMKLFSGNGHEGIILLPWLAYVIYFQIRAYQGKLGKRLSIIAILSYLIQLVVVFAMFGFHRY
ncbi:MAG: cytochrome c biogenesis protein CcsA [Candidatus Cloacimonetes bacterium]|nr:cytochrome c biogenesis protein CcsA [Candidatus Cloacimonadota bacterium]